MKKYITPLNIVFSAEVIIVVLASLGFLPREAVLFLTGLMVFYMIFSSATDALYLIVMSIPLFVALPITDTFDSMANWRILVAVLFLCLFFKKGLRYICDRFYRANLNLKEIFRKYPLEFLTLAFLFVAILSISVANYKILAIKKLLFLINIFLLYLVIRNMVRDKESILKIFRAAAAAGIVVIGVSLIQFITVLFIPLYTFWQFWAGKVIAVFYGQNLANLLSCSNTWFAYYAVNPPTLRLFSVFPDSHSFAISLILTIPIFLTLAVYKNSPPTSLSVKGGVPLSLLKERLGDNSRKIFWWLMTVLALSGIVLSGSRGAWLSVVPIIGVVLYLYARKTEKLLVKKSLLTFGIFILLFLSSVGYPSLLYKFQSWQTGQAPTTTFAFFERAKSISQLQEISNKGRLEIWQASLRSLIKYPILGVGLGNYVKVLDEDVSAAKKGASAHNLYLDFANEIGIFGAIILILIFIEILRTTWLVFHAGEDNYFKVFGLLFGLYFLWVMVYSLFDVVLLNDKVLLFFVAELGILYGIKALTEKEKGQSLETDQN